jgi:hypothetical protein
MPPQQAALELPVVLLAAKAGSQAVQSTSSVRGIGTPPASEVSRCIAGDLLQGTVGYVVVQGCKLQSAVQQTMPAFSIAMQDWAL